MFLQRPVLRQGLHQERRAQHWRRELVFASTLSTCVFLLLEFSLGSWSPKASDHAKCAFGFSGVILLSSGGPEGRLCSTNRPLGAEL